MNADAKDGPRARLLALAQRARATLLWERVWPPLAWALGVVALFLAASWIGVWLDAPSYARMVGLVKAWPQQPVAMTSDAMKKALHVRG